MEYLQGATLVLLVAFWAMTWLAAKTAWEDARAYGYAPAGIRWVMGQAALGVAITLVFVPRVWIFLFEEMLAEEVRIWIGFIVLLICVLGKWATQRGFAIHRDAARYRRQGPPVRK